MCGQCDEMDREENEAAEERAALMDSEIACAVVDTWLAAQRSGRGFTLPNPGPQADAFLTAITRLKEATRGSALRKVRP